MTTPEERAATAGTWVRQEDLHPMTNVWRRRWWSETGTEGTFNGEWPTLTGAPPPKVWWHFPNDPAPRQETAPSERNTP